MTKSNQDTLINLTTAYRRMIEAAIERTCIRRIEEEHGSVPSDGEIRMYGRMEVTEGSGIVIYYWKDQPICEFVPAGFTPDGWRDATVSALQLRTETL